MRIEEIRSEKGLKKGISLWNKRREDFLLNEKIIRQNLLSPYKDLNSAVLGCWHEDELKGFAALKWLSETVKNYAGPGDGWISLFTASDDCRREIFQEILTFFSDREVKKIRYGGDPQNFFAGLPAKWKDKELNFWLEAGFERGNAIYDMRRVYGDDIESDDYLSRYLSRGSENNCILKKGSRKIQEQAIKFLKKEFPGRWLYEAENIMKRPGGVHDYWFLAEDETSKEEIKSSDILGFARINRCDSLYLGPGLNWVEKRRITDCNIAGIGPLGLAQSARGRGLSLPFIAEIIRDLHREGYREFIIDWTDLVNYYKKLGFEVWRKYIPLNLNV